MKYTCEGMKAISIKIIPWTAHFCVHLNIKNMAKITSTIPLTILIPIGDGKYGGIRGR